MKILLVEDDPNWARLFYTMLHQRGFDTKKLTILQDGRMAKAFLMRDVQAGYEDAPRPDIIFTDHYMPYGTGLDVIKAAREQEVLQLIPIILMTGASLSDSTTGRNIMREAWEFGCTSFIVKSNNRDLCTTFDYWLTIAKW